MIDIHSHILPGIDDGSQSVEESHALLALLREQGVETVVATPHFYADRNDPENFLRRRKEALARLDHGETEMPRILLGAEVAYLTACPTARNYWICSLAHLDFCW